MIVGLLGGLALAGAGGDGDRADGQTRRRGAAPARARRAEGLIGQIGVVRSWAEPSGKVSLDGALWQAASSPRGRSTRTQSPSSTSGDRVVVERLDGLTLSVRPAEDWELV